MTLLDNALIFKYFGCMDENHHPVYHQCNEKRTIAFKVMEAMEKPIKKGDKVLVLLGCDSEKMEVREDAAPFLTGGFHSYLLRLPDKFQPSEKKECDHNQFKHRCLGCDETIHTEEPKEPEKCECTPACNHGYSERCNCCGALEKPADPVEAKIEEKMHYGEHSIWSDVQLHELVALARREGGSNA